MNKTQLIDKVAEKIGSSKTDARAAVEAVLDSISDSLKEGDAVQIVGFGTFKTNKRQARTGRNPQTGAPLKIPEKIVPAFIAGKGLKDKVEPPSEAKGRKTTGKSSSAGKGSKSSDKKDNTGKK